MSFQSVCALYDKLSNTSGASGKKHILKGFITEWKRNEQDVYDLLRLLIPKVLII
jgi:hypothetical protein